MGLFHKMKLGWQSMTLEEKFSLIIDVISGAGCGIASVAIGNKLSEGRNILERICINTATAGIGLAAADVSSKALKENYGKPMAEMIGMAKAKMAEEKAKEGAKHE